MRFSKEDVERARGVDIHGVLGLQNRGRIVQVQCPMPGHRDRSPSFTIYPDNSFHCFGCGAHGRNFVDFVMAQQEVDFGRAVAMILEEIGELNNNTQQ